MFVPFCSFLRFICTLVLLNLKISNFLRLVGHAYVIFLRFVCMCMGLGIFLKINLKDLKDLYVANLKDLKDLKEKWSTLKFGRF
mgnify:CR=1 FL=1